MNTAMTKEGLERILDEAVQDVTERTVSGHEGSGSFWAACILPRAL